MGTYDGLELDDVELVGERLVLRRWRDGDAPAVARALGDPTMREFLALDTPYTLDHARAFVAGAGHEGRGSGEGLGCAVVERAGDRLVGAATLRLTREPDIGFWIVPDGRGRGFAAEACRMLADWGTSTLGLHRIALSCDVANAASARTAQLAGFAYEGTARDGAVTQGGVGVPPGRVDLARFARLATDDGLPLAPSFTRLPSGGLGDGVITVRATEPADAQGLFEADDALATGWGFTGTASSLAECLRRARRARLEWLVGRTAPMTILDTATGDYAGEIMLRQVGPPQVGALGYTVHPAYRGRGYTTRALRLVRRWAFDAAGYVRLELGAKPGNIASQRSAGHAGFVPEAVLPARLRNPDGTFSDEAAFGLVRPDVRPPTSER